MLSNKLRRLKIIDGLLSKGKPVSFMDIAEELDKHFHLCSSKFSYSGQYGDNFRSDMKIIRDTIADSSFGIPKDMLMTEGGNKFKKYWYAEPGFRIMPYLNHSYTTADLKALNKSLEIMADTLPEDLFKIAEFALKSRIEYEFGKEEKGIDYGENFSLKGRHWLPFLYKSLNKTVLHITYKPFYWKDAFSFILHPYLLKQYNNRWFLFGRMECHDDNMLKDIIPNIENIDRNFWNVPIDRIENIEEKKDITFISKPQNYLNHFKDIIGVTNKMKDPVEEVHFLVHGKTAKYIFSKPIHGSQHMQWIDDDTLDVRIKVKINYELKRTLLSYAADITILSPKTLIEEHKKTLEKALRQY